MNEKLETCESKTQSPEVWGTESTKTARRQTRATRKYAVKTHIVSDKCSGHTSLLYRNLNCNHSLHYCTNTR